MSLLQLLQRHPEAIYERTTTREQPASKSHRSRNQNGVITGATKFNPLEANVLYKYSE